MRAFVRLLDKVFVRKADGAVINPSTEEKLEEVRALIEAVRALIEAEDFASQTTLAAVLAAVDGLEGALETLNGKDFATTAGQAAILGAVDGLEPGLAALNGKDFATETTLALVKAKTDNLDLALTALRDALRGASNRTLTDLYGLLDSVETLLGTLDVSIDEVSAKLSGVNYTYAVPTQATVGSASGEIVPSTSGFRKVIIKVHPTATAGIYVNFGAAATSAHFLLGPGEVATYHTAQQIRAIRAGAVDVTIYIQTAVAA